jgi:hypothetical protein
VEGANQLLNSNVSINFPWFCIFLHLEVIFWRCIENLQWLHRKWGIPSLERMENRNANLSPGWSLIYQCIVVLGVATDFFKNSPDPDPTLTNYFYSPWYCVFLQPVHKVLGVPWQRSNRWTPLWIQELQRPNQSKYANLLLAVKHIGHQGLTTLLSPLELTVAMLPLPLAERWPITALNTRRTSQR